MDFPPISLATYQPFDYSKFTYNSIKETWNQHTRTCCETTKKVGKIALYVLLMLPMLIFDAVLIAASLAYRCCCRKKLPPIPVAVNLLQLPHPERIDLNERPPEHMEEPHLEDQRHHENEDIHLDEYQGPPLGVEEELGHEDRLDGHQAEDGVHEEVGGHAAEEDFFDPDLGGHAAEEGEPDGVGDDVEIEEEEAEPEGPPEGPAVGGAGAPGPLHPPAPPPRVPTEEEIARALATPFRNLYGAIPIPIHLKNAEWVVDPDRYLAQAVTASFDYLSPEKAAYYRELLRFGGMNEAGEDGEIEVYLWIAQCTILRYLLASRFEEEDCPEYLRPYMEGNVDERDNLEAISLAIDALDRDQKAALILQVYNPEVKWAMEPIAKRLFEFQICGLAQNLSRNGVFLESIGRVYPIA